MNSGKLAFCAPAALIRASISACIRSHRAYPYGRITIVPRTGPLSASSAFAITSWYQRGKSSACGVSTDTRAMLPNATGCPPPAPNRLRSPQRAPGRLPSAASTACTWIRPEHVRGVHVPCRARLGGPGCRQEAPMARTLPANADLPQLRTQAKELRRAVADGNPSALARAREVCPDAEPARFTLRDAQLVLAREYGFDGWHELATKVGTDNVNQRDLHRWFGVELNKRDLGDGRAGRHPRLTGRGPGAGAVRGVRRDVPLDAGGHAGQPRPRRVPDPCRGHRGRPAGRGAAACAALCRDHPDAPRRGERLRPGVRGRGTGPPPRRHPRPGRRRPAPRPRPGAAPGHPPARPAGPRPAARPRAPRPPARPLTRRPPR